MNIHASPVRREYLLKEKKEKLQGLPRLIVEDVVHSRVARANMAALAKMGVS